MVDGSKAAASASAIPRRGVSIRTLVGWMVAAIAAVAGLAYWDEHREAGAALEDFADDQAWLADALSRGVTERLRQIDRDARDRAQGLAGTPQDDDVRIATTVAADEFAFHVDGADGRRVQAAVPFARLLSSIRSFERPGDVRVLVQPPAREDFVSVEGSMLRSPAISDALRAGRRSVTLSRTEAAALGLPARMAMAGLAHVDGHALGAWSVAVVATAQSERDRELRARVRLLLGVAVVAVLVVAFGGAAVRIRTHEIELRHALAVKALEAERDERLVHADKLATMGALAIGIAHEVSTPLGVILARAEQIVRRSGDDERIRRSAGVIVAESERINQVIRGLLGLVRDRAPLLEDADPAAIAENAVALVSHRFDKAGVTLEAHLTATAPIACDRRLLEQVLVNLLLNACEATAEGGHVALTLRPEGEHVLFTVTDDGVGIRPDDAARALEPFFTTKPEGTGLGLAIASEIVKHHRGTLTLKARTDVRGTHAIIALPTSPSQQVEADHA